MASIKKLCTKAKDKQGWKNLSFEEMVRLAEYFGAKVEAKEGSIYNIYYHSTNPDLQLHKPHGGRADVPLDYKKKFINLFADEIDRGTK